MTDCKCRMCLEKIEAKPIAPGWPPTSMAAHRFIVCEYCGNKRCPHASNHEYVCTNSNDPGQKGSDYE